MELKDVILSTLAEMEDNSVDDAIAKFEVKETLSVKKTPIEDIAVQEIKEVVKIVETQEETSSKSELFYLNSIRERLLVLFEGFQAPNNTNIEAKVDMTLNFLEYVLATIDSRVELLEKGNK